MFKTISLHNNNLMLYVGEALRIIIVIQSVCSQKYISKMIKRKTCKCGCSKYPTISCKGYNYECLPTEFKKEICDKKRLQQRKRNTTKRITAKLRTDSYKDNNELELWFRYHMLNSKKVCENCGANLRHYNEKDWLGSQHHVLEKSIFPSVKVNLDNHIILGKWCCHSQFHTSMLNASKMNIFPKCREIVKKLYPFLTDREKGKLSEFYMSGA